jgi:putative addiction module killer protein
MPSGTQRASRLTSVSIRILSRVLIIQRSSEFDAWLDQLADLHARARIVARVRRATLGNFGDCKPVGEGVSEMRVDVGSGYRIYFVRKGIEVYVLLVGGDKSTQKRDIKQAIAMARKLKEQGYGD